MARPRKNATVETPVVEKVADAVAPTEDTTKGVLDKVKAFVSLSPEVETQLVNLGKGLAVSAADSALVYLNENVATIDLGTFKPTAVGLTNLLVRELRNLLHGGEVSSDVHLEALKCVVGEDESKSDE